MCGNTSENNPELAYDRKERADQTMMEPKKLESIPKGLSFLALAMWHTDLIRKMKVDLKLEDMRQNINEIRRNQKEHVMLKLKTSTEGNVEGFNSELGNLLVDKG